MSLFAWVAIVPFVNTSSFHTHTRLCKHASGEPAEYVLQATKDGCSALGFSDHCPYPDDATWPGSRMSVRDVSLYREQVLSLRQDTPFPIYYGFECEWFPLYESWYRDFIRGECGAEYVVYGSHWVRDAGEFWYIPEAAEKRLLGSYLDLTLQALETGLYDLFAHPDIFLAGYTRMDSDIRSACQQIIASAIHHDIPMEINGLGLKKPFVYGDSGLRPPYPVREFWEMAADMGAKIVCSSDAHRSEDVITGARFAKAQADEWGIQTMDPYEVLGLPSVLYP